MIQLGRLILLHLLYFLYICSENKTQLQSWASHSSCECMCIYSPQLHVSNSTYNVILVFSHTRYFKIISWDMSWKYALFANRNVGTTPKRKGQLRPKFLSYWKFPFWNLVWYFVMFRTVRQIVTFVKVGQWGCRNDEEN